MEKMDTVNSRFTPLIGPWPRGRHGQRSSKWNSEFIRSRIRGSILWKMRATATASSGRRAFTDLLKFGGGERKNAGILHGTGGLRMH
jgi:hypothetical protein